MLIDTAVWKSNLEAIRPWLVFTLANGIWAELART